MKKIRILKQGDTKPLPTSRSSVLRKIRQGFLVILVSLTAISTIFGDILKNTSTPGVSLGNSFYPGYVTSVALNPALRLKRTQLAASYTLLMDNARYNVFAYGQPFEKFSLSLLLTQLYRDNIEVRETLTEEPLTHTYVNKIGALLSLSAKVPYDFTVGSSLKMLYLDIYNTKSNYALGTDLGLARNIYSHGNVLKKRINVDLAFALRNIFGPTIKFGSEKETYKEEAQLTLIGSLTLFPKYNVGKEIFTYDEISLFINYVKDLTLGLEYWRDKYFLRLGSNPKLYKKFSLGLGASFGDLNLDYTFTPFVDYGLHYFSCLFQWGEVQPEQTPPELDDFLKVKKKAERVYGHYLREATTLLKDKKYESAKQLLGKIAPLFPEKKEAKKLLSAAKNFILSEKLNQVNKEYTDFLSQGLFSQAFEKVILALDLAPKENITKQLLQDFKKKDIPAGEIELMRTKQNTFVREVNNRISQSLLKKDFQAALCELEKLKLLEPDTENTFNQKKKIELEIKSYTDSLVRKALQFTKDEKKFAQAYPLFKEAYRVSEDQGVKMQLESTKEKIPQPNLYDDLYQKKLYFTAAISYALDETQQAKEIFFELKNFNPAFDYDYLEETLLRSNLIQRSLP